MTETRNNGKEKTEKGEKVDENLHYAFIGGARGVMKDAMDAEQAAWCPRK